MRLVLIAMFGLLPLSAFAQGRERGGVGYLYEAEAPVEDGGDLALQEYEVRTGLPPWRSGSRMLTLGLRWTAYDFQTTDAELGDFTTHSFRLPIRGALNRSNEWSWSVLVTPALRSDLERVTTDDLGFNGLVLGSYPWRPQVKVTAGLVYGQNFGRSRFFPALGATWLPAPGWQVDLVFPRPRVTYAANSNVVLNATLEPGGDEWNIERNGASRDLALEEYRAGAGLEWTVAGPWVVALQGGYVFDRSLEQRDGRRKEWERDLGDTWFARIGLLYR